MVSSILLQGFVRFENGGDAQKAADAFAANKTELQGAVPELTVLEGAEEEAYYKKMNDDKKNLRKGTFKRGGGRGGRGGKRGGHGGKRDYYDFLSLCLLTAVSVSADTGVITDVNDLRSVYYLRCSMVCRIYIIS
jgi:hypothetical protein